jgi:hypothetical protein
MIVDVHVNKAREDILASHVYDLGSLGILGVASSANCGDFLTFDYNNRVRKRASAIPINDGAAN